MDQEKSIKITNVRQFECLVKLMEENKEIAKGYFSFGSSKQEYNQAWNNFSEQLNSLGPPVREGAGWQKVWTDFKGKIKKKLSNNKKEILATGGGPCRLQILSPLEESVSRLLCYDILFDKPNTSFGLRKRTSTETETILTTGVSPTVVTTQSTAVSVSNDVDGFQGGIQIDFECAEEVTGKETGIPIPPKRRKKNTMNSERHSLLETQTKYLEHIEQNTKECARYARKSFELKQKKFKMWHEFQLDKQKYNKIHLELKLRNIQYKENKLAFEETRYRN